MKTVEQKLFKGEHLRLEEHYVYNEAHGTITSILNTPLCDKFTSPSTNLPAVCCKVMIARKLSIFCTHTSLIINSLPSGFGMLVLKCANGTVNMHYNRYSGMICVPVTRYWNPYSLRFSFNNKYFDNSKLNGRADTNPTQNTPLPTQEVLKSDSEETGTIFLDIRSTRCSNIGILDLCTQYVSSIHVSTQISFTNT